MLGFLSFATSQTGRWVVIGTLTVIIVWAFITRQNHLLSKLHKYRAELEARKTQTKIQEKSNETSKQVAAARSDIRSSPDRASHELHDDEFEQLFGYRRDSGEPAG